MQMLKVGKGELLDNVVAEAYYGTLFSLFGDSRNPLEERQRTYPDLGPFCSLHRLFFVLAPNLLTWSGHRATEISIVDCDVPVGGPSSSYLHGVGHSAQDYMPLIGVSIITMMYIGPKNI
jgi:hypothetical protein